MLSVSTSSQLLAFFGTQIISFPPSLGLGSKGSFYLVLSYFFRHGRVVRRKIA
jgi:hypothetical protein